MEKSTTVSKESYHREINGRTVQRDFWLLRLGRKNVKPGSEKWYFILSDTRLSTSPEESPRRLGSLFRSSESEQEIREIEAAAKRTYSVEGWAAAGE